MYVCMYVCNFSHRKEAEQMSSRLKKSGQEKRKKKQKQTKKKGRRRKRERKKLRDSYPGQFALSELPEEAWNRVRIFPTSLTGDVTSEIAEDAWERGCVGT